MEWDVAGGQMATGLRVLMNYSIVGTLLGWSHDPCLLGWQDTRLVSNQQNTAKMMGCYFCNLVTKDCAFCLAGQLFLLPF